MSTNITSISALGANGLAGAVEAQPRLFQSTPQAATAATPEDALKVGRQFESMYLSEMLQPMFSGIKTNTLFGGGHGEEAFRSMQIDEYAKAMTAQGGIGLAAAVQRQILQIQEQAHGPAPAAS